MEELAARAGLHRTYIGLLERAERQPTIVAAGRIAEALGLSLGDLIRDSERDDLEQPGVRTQTTFDRSTTTACTESDADLRATTGLDASVILASVDDAYRTLDLLDGQLMEAGVPPFAELVELANLSAILGNLLGAAIAKHSRGSYERSGPHKYQDLRSTSGREHIEIKTALEANRPKGHLAKPGAYLTFRYVLALRDGKYDRRMRSDTAFIWEIRFGNLNEQDFDVSDTPGDSGKTAVIKTNVLKKMERIYFDPNFLPYARLEGPWGLNRL
jgi:transcriptional regulator with XRE-family HTH domain